MMRIPLYVESSTTGICRRFDEGSFETWGWPNRGTGSGSARDSSGK